MLFCDRIALEFNRLKMSTEALIRVPLDLERLADAEIDLRDAIAEQHAGSNQRRGRRCRAAAERPPQVLHLRGGDRIGGGDLRDPAGSAASRSR